MTPLRKIMLEELQRRNYASTTIRGYILAVEAVRPLLRQVPGQLGPKRSAQLSERTCSGRRSWRSGTVALRMGALRFLYKKTLKRRDLDFDDLPLLKRPKKLPVVLSPEEVTRLIEAAPNLLYRTLLMVLYATGLRRSEAAHLKVSDIDRSLMLIHVQQGKGSRDRKLPLTQKVSKRYASIGGRRRSSPGCTCSRPARNPPNRRNRSPTKWCGTRVMKRRCVPVSPSASGRTPYGTASRPTCWNRVPTCARSSCCWGMSV